VDEPREAEDSYGPLFAPKNSDLSSKNADYWDLFHGISICYLGPTRIESPTSERTTEFTYDTAGNLLTVKIVGDARTADTTTSNKKGDVGVKTTYCMY